MTPSTATARDSIARPYPEWTEWLIHSSAKGVSAIVMIASICVGSVAVAAVTSAEFGGRWRADQHKLTLDVSRCGDGWCGVEVSGATGCGRVVLRLDAGAQKPDAVEFSGQLQLAAKTEPYGLQATLLRRGDALSLQMSGHTGGSFQIARRTFDFHGVFARVGDALCKPDGKVS